MCFVFFSRSCTRSLTLESSASFAYSTIDAASLVLATLQGNEDESEADGKRRERSLLLLSSLGTDALDEVSGVGKVCQHVAIFLLRMWRRDQATRIVHFRGRIDPIACLPGLSTPCGVIPIITK